ncbi:hypothetical protein [Pediococcus pentosaceus]|nr:hypothetical protein [Pediococcus pentosaceus]
METNKKAEAIKAWLANHKKQETQTTLSAKFGKSRTFLNRAINKQDVGLGAENLVNGIYEYLHEKYGI